VFFKSFFMFFFASVALAVAQIAPAAFRCPVDGKKYIARRGREAVLECPQGQRLQTRPYGRTMCVDENDHTIGRAKPRYCCQHGQGARTTRGRKIIIRRNADGSGRFCDIVDWGRLMRADLRHQHVIGWDMDAAKAAPEPVDGDDTVTPLPNVYMSSDGRFQTVTVIEP
jgi:hypothetical protein